MRKLRLEIKNSLVFIRVLSGLFINKDNPNGLTNKEIQLLALIIMLMQKEGVNVITRLMRKDIRKEMNLSPRNLYNTISELKRKQALTRNDMLASVLRPPVSLTIEFPMTIIKQQHNNE